jgi:hypothetical protein
MGRVNVRSSPRKSALPLQNVVHSSDLASSFAATLAVGQVFRGGALGLVMSQPTDPMLSLVRGELSATKLRGN